MSLKAMCDNCSAYMAQSADQGICRAKPPTVLMIGLRQSAVLPGIPGSGGAEPQFSSIFPPMKRNGWCRDGWQPNEETEAKIRKEAERLAVAEIDRHQQLELGETELHQMASAGEPLIDLDGRDWRRPIT